MKKKSKKSVSKKKRSPSRRRPAPRMRMTRASAKPKPRARAFDEKPLTTSQVQEFRSILTQKRDDLLAIVQRKKEQEIEDTDVGDEADVATRSVEKEMLFELTDSEKQTLDMIEAALRKIEKGVFGLCENCQKPISKMRVDIMPWARYCMPCQSDQEAPTPPEA